MDKDFEDIKRMVFLNFQMLAVITEYSIEIYHILNGVLIHEEKVRAGCQLLIVEIPNEMTRVVIYDKTLQTIRYITQYFP